MVELESSNMGAFCCLAVIMDLKTLQSEQLLWGLEIFLAA